eukprot:6204280-Pleurochrysis_carterae.AAC.5
MSLWIYGSIGITISVENDRPKYVNYIQTSISISTFVNMIKRRPQRYRKREKLKTFVRSAAVAAPGVRRPACGKCRTMRNDDF